MLAVPGVEDRDFSAPALLPLRRLAHLRAGALRLDPHLRVRVPAGLRADRDHRLGRAAAGGRPRSRRPQHATGCAPPACPSPGSEIRVVDSSTGEDVPVGDVGEIWMRGPTVMKGYWNLPEATEEAIRPGGWFRSGDAGYFDEDGYLYLYDRVKDMIVSGGENVYPAEVENVLMSHPGVADVAVIGVPSDKWGETPKAMVVRAPDVDVDRAGAHRPLPGAAWPASSARPASTGSTCCPATRAARCSRRTCARPSGRAAIARSAESARVRRAPVPVRHGRDLRPLLRAAAPRVRPEATTAEQLMRSRYSAYAVLDDELPPRTRGIRRPGPRPIALDPALEWVQLEIVATDRRWPVRRGGHRRVPGPPRARRPARRAARGEPLRPRRPPLGLPRRR